MQHLWNEKLNLTCVVRGADGEVAEGFTHVATRSAPRICGTPMGDGRYCGSRVGHACPDHDAARDLRREWAAGVIANAERVLAAMHDPAAVSTYLGTYAPVRVPLIYPVTCDGTFGRTYTTAPDVVSHEGGVDLEDVIDRARKDGLACVRLRCDALDPCLLSSCFPRRFYVSKIVNTELYLDHVLDSDRYDERCADMDGDCATRARKLGEYVSRVQNLLVDAKASASQGTFDASWVLTTTTGAASRTNSSASSYERFANEVIVSPSRPTAARGSPSARDDDDATASPRAPRDGAPVPASVQESTDGPRAGVVTEASTSLMSVSSCGGALRRAPVALEREVGTVLDIHWSAEGTTYRGSVVRVDPDSVLVHYPCDRTPVWHDFDKDECTCEVVEPAAHTLTQLRRTERGYDGKVDPTARRWYAMDREHVETVFRREREWLGSLPLFRGTGDGGFVLVPTGARRAGQAAPLCVLGSLAKALRYAGDETGAKLVEADFAPSLVQKDRMKYAAVRAPTWRYEAHKVRGRAIDMGATELPTLLRVSRTHAVTIMGGMIFDYAEAKPLPLTRENLTRCIGAPYDGAEVRGYELVRSDNRKRLAGTKRAPDAAPDRPSKGNSVSLSPAKSRREQKACGRD